MASRNASREHTRGSSIFVKALAFAMPSIGVALLLVPVVTVLSGIYAKNFGLTLTTIASVMLIARVFDAVTDPIIGYCSDRWRLRTGSRKSFMLAGVILLVPCSYFLFVPGGTVSAAYFTFWYLAFYLSLTIFAIPQLAWINEFTTDTKEKTLVFSVMAIVGMAGSAMFYAIPLLPFFVSTEITPQTLKVTVIVGAAFLIPGLFLALKVVPDGPAPEPLLIAHDEHQQSIAAQIVAVLKAMVGNKPFVLFVMSFMCLGIGSGMWFGMFFIYVDAYLKLGEEFAKISLWGMGIGAAAVPIWYRLSLYFETGVR